MRAEAAVLPLVVLPLIVIAIDAGAEGEFGLGRAAAGYLYDILVGLAVGATIGLEGRLGATPHRRQAAADRGLLLDPVPGRARRPGRQRLLDRRDHRRRLRRRGLYSGRAPERPYSASTQALGRAFWQQVTLLLSGALAFIVGLSIPTALEGIEIAPARMVGYVAAALR
jgi:NhaP-type Na+/H+ or K+/H+ antiporter